MNERKRQVLLTAQHLFINKGFHATSIQDILEAAQIAKGTFYNYFKSKNECLMAILEQAHIESMIKRREMLIDDNISSKDILMQQISIRMLVNREQNLLPLYEAVFYSGDAELRTFIWKQHLHEIRWLSERITDVYGEETKPYAFEGAVMLVGMIQQFIQIFYKQRQQHLDVTQVVVYCLQRLDSIMASLSEESSFLFTDSLLTDDLNSNKTPAANSSSELAQQFTGFLSLLEKEMKCQVQFTQFIIEELQQTEPRIFVLSTVVRSFREAFKNTRHEPEAYELASQLWMYIDDHKQD